MLIGTIRRAIWWAMAGLVAVFGVWTAAKREARLRRKIDDANDYRKTRERIDHALENGSGLSVDDMRDRLRERGKR